MESVDILRTQFREAMACLSAAVNVITSHGASGPCGITATAVCSVSDAPPSLLICLNRNSALNAVFRANGVVCVNVLAATQEQQARHFAGMTGVAMHERFGGPEWEFGANGVPALRDALASLHGRIVQTQEVGSHTVMIVEIDAICIGGQDYNSLVYFRRSFHRIEAPLANAT